MDVSAIASSLFSNFNWPALIFAVLFLVSDILGAHPKIKTSSIYEVIKAMIYAFKDQVLPKPAPVEVVAPPVEPTTPKV